MSTFEATVRSNPRTSGGLGAWIKQHPLMSYFAALYAVGWIVFLPLLLSQEGFGVLPITLPHQLFTSMASIVGGTLPALLLAVLMGGRPAGGQFLRRFVEWRVGIQWYVFALVGAPAIYLFAAAALSGPGVLDPVVDQQLPGLTGYLSDVLQRALFVSLWEEAGLMAFPFLLLQRRYGPVKGSLILGPLWALMHLPATLIPGMVATQRLTPPMIFMYMVVLIILSLPVRIILTWLFNHTKGSVLFIAVFHSTFDQTTGAIARLIPSFNPLAGAAAFIVLALVLVILTRGRLSYRTEVQAAALGLPGRSTEAQM